MKRAQFRTILAFVLTLVVGAYGCGGDDDGGDGGGDTSGNTSNSTSNATSNGTGGAVTSSNPDYEGPDMLEANDYRVNALELVSPAEPASTLNIVVADGLEMGEVNIIIRLKQYTDTVVPTTLVVQGDAGVDNGDGTFSWDPEAAATEVAASVDDKGAFMNTEPLPLVNFPIKVPGEPVVYLPLRNLSFSGKLKGADELVNGTLAGTITKEDADNLIVPIGNGISLSVVLGDPDTDTDGDSTNDAWSLEGALSAEAVTFQ